MRSNAITVCVNYDDYLAHTLPNNRHLFDDYYIITNKICESSLKQIAKAHNAKLVITDKFYENGAAFNKGKAINVALKQISAGWLCHLDADILLPKNFDPDNLKKNTIYGMPRRMCPDADAYLAYLQEPSVASNWPQENFGFNKLYKTVGRLSEILKYLKEKPEFAYKYDLFIPIGYFQLFFHDKTKFYPENSNDASNSDIHFARKWSEAAQLPFEAVHLPVIDGISQHNWRGRKTPKFEI